MDGRFCKKFSIAEQKEEEIKALREEDSIKNEKIQDLLLENSNKMAIIEENLRNFGDVESQNQQMQHKMQDLSSYLLENKENLGKLMNIVSNSEGIDEIARSQLEEKLVLLKTT